MIIFDPYHHNTVREKSFLILYLRYSSLAVFRFVKMFEAYGSFAASPPEDET